MNNYNEIHTDDNIKIMLLDNELSFTDAYSTILTSYGYTVKSFTDPMLALEELKKVNYDILLANYLLYPFNADKLTLKIREFNKDIYILLMTSHTDLVPPIETMHSLDIQAYCEKSANSNQLIMMVESAVKSIKQLNEIKNINTLLKRHYLEFAEVLKNTVEAKDSYTKGHSDRVSLYAVQLAEYLHLSKEDEEILRVSGLFHDIGKIGISDSILTKPGRLTTEEYNQIKLHPSIGYDIISSSFMLETILQNVKHHHERIDGNGYPDRLKGDEIPFFARVLAVCDTYDAITSNRTYRQGTDVKTALKILIENKNTQLDGNLVDSFVAMVNKDIKKYEEILKTE
ncbi:MAG: HD domain-containing protein [Clostridia bacterium]